MKKILRLLSFAMALVLLCTSYITVGAVATDKLFISEVCYNPGNKSSDDYCEYIEFVNISSQPVDLSGAKVTYSGDGAAAKVNNMYTAGTGLVQPGETAVIVIFQKNNTNNGSAYGNATEINAFRGVFNEFYGSEVSANNFFVAAKVGSGSTSTLSNAFNLGNSHEVAVIKILDGTDAELCQATYNAVKHNKNNRSVIFGLSETEGPRCMGTSNTTPGISHKELYTKSTNNFTENIKFMTYNICASGFAYDVVAPDGSSNAEYITDAAHYISARYDDVLAVIDAQDPDVLCLNELNGEWWSYIGPTLSEEYGFYGISSTTGKEASALKVNSDKWDTIPMVLYKKAKFTLVDQGSFWCPPDNRGLRTPNNWVKLENKETGARFLVMTQHLRAGSVAENQQVRIDSAELILETLKGIKGDLPVVIMGDFNCYDGTTEYNLFVNGGFNDSSRMYPDADLMDSCIGFEKKTEQLYVDLPIDLFMLSEGDFDVTNYKVLDTTMTGGFAVSDHSPVVTEVTMRTYTEEFNAFELLDTAAGKIKGNYFYMNREGIANIDFLKASFKSPLFYVLSSTKNPGTGDTISLASDPEQFLTVIMQGDVTGDGLIKSTDYSRIKNYFKGRATPNENQLLAGDLNGDGKILTSDYIRIKMHIKGDYNIFA